MNGASKSPEQLRRAANWINGIPRFDGVLKESINPATYEYLPPALVGRERQFILGKHTGTKALRYVTASLGHQLTDPQIGQVLALIKERSEHKCSITPEVLKDLILQVEKGRC